MKEILSTLAREAALSRLSVYSIKSSSSPITFFFSRGGAAFGVLREPISDSINPSISSDNSSYSFPIRT